MYSLITLLCEPSVMMHLTGKEKRLMPEACFKSEVQIRLRVLAKAKEYQDFTKKLSKMADRELYILGTLKVSLGSHTLYFTT